ncbi:MAG: N-acetylmuramoyl-L-alanine amidase [Clostridia bacterium]|nr:N-acetylmuramoyl-L-alanine amidase [Clostridia bacterium]
MIFRLHKTVAIMLFILVYMLSGTSLTVFADKFPDVGQDHKNYDAVTELVDMGVIAGYDDGFFRPEREITRTEFCALMARTLGYDKDTYQILPELFADVKPGYWGEAYISFCYELGLVNGMGNNEFWPADKVTLAQAAKMAVCAINKQDEALLETGDKWYDGYIKIAGEYGLLDFVDGQVDLPAIRGDIAQIVFNMIESGLTDKDFDEEDDEMTGEEIQQEKPEEEESTIPPEILAAYRKKDFSEVRTILVDAGHNYRGKDIGAENIEFDLKEEEITWQIADKLRENLEDMGYEVIMTREKMTDSIENSSVVGSLQARVDLGHSSMADLFISLHCNAGGGSGTEVYCFQKTGYAGRLAKLVQRNITDATTLYDREVKTANFFVIKNTLMPAILVETGFIDSEKDIPVISSDRGQTAIAKAIAEAVLEYDDMPPIEKTVKEVQKNEDSEEAGASGTGREPEQT